MRRVSFHSVPALLAALLFAGGILANTVVSLPTSILLVAATVILLVTACLLLPARNNPRAVPVRTLLLITLSVVLGAAKASFDLSTTSLLPKELVRRPVVVIGTVLEPSLPRGTKQQFLFRTSSMILGDGQSFPVEHMVAVTVTRQRRDSVTVSFRYGEKLALKGHVYRPSAERNPGEFNSRAYYEAQGITYLMRVRGHSNVTLLESILNGGFYSLLMKEIVLPIRFHVLTLIDQTIGGEEGELLKGILIGERGGIPFSTRTAFVNSGIAHILAVSGSNVVVVYAFFAMLFGLFRIRRHAAILLTGLMLILYMLVTGNQPPIVRATIMALVLLFGKLRGGRSNSLNAIGVAALIILGYDSRQLFDVGFQLSFAAVVAIIYFYPPINELILKLGQNALWRRGLVAGLQVSAVTLVATLGTLPLTAIYFGKVSIVGVFTNMIILPLVGVSVSLGFVSILVGWMVLPFAGVFAAVNKPLLWLILELAHFSGNLSWAFVETLRFHPAHAVPFYLALLCIFHFSFIRISRVLVIMFLGSLNLFLVVPERRLDGLHVGKMRVSFIDVGQGDAALIELPGSKTMLIDAGMWSEEYDAGEMIVTPFLKRRGITTLDWFIASHPHVDHIGGVPRVFHAFDVKEVIESGQPSRDPFYARYRDAIEREQATVKQARAYDSVITVAGANMYFLFPSDEVMTSDSTDRYKNLNNTSVVVKLTFGETSFLFLGDLEREGETELCRMFGEFLRADVLKVGHHGSRTSSSMEMLELVRPIYAVISVGRNNKFNHPSDDVLDRLQALGTEILRTDEEGALVFETDGRMLERVLWR